MIAAFFGPCFGLFYIIIVFFRVVLYELLDSLLQDLLSILSIFSC